MRGTRNVKAFSSPVELVNEDRPEGLFAMLGTDSLDLSHQ